jgi:hypothetical protein
MSRLEEPPSESSQVQEPSSDWARAQELPNFPSLESAEPFDGRPLVLTAELTEALEALARFAEQSPPADFWRRRTESASGIQESRTHISLVALAAATAVIQSGLPSCPYAPPGIPISIQFLPPTNKEVQRCGHVDPAHCWEGLGTVPYEC